jgi:acetyl esterase/lipase
MTNQRNNMEKSEMIITGCLISLAATALAGGQPAAQEVPTPAALSSNSAPTFADVTYGPHKKQVLDFYKADSATPTPLVFFIHGGAWMQGNKRKLRGVGVEDYLNAGISVVSIEYRFIAEATADGEQPPVRGPLLDAARALQFVRSRAAEWNIDKTRIAITGSSAGACSGLWLAFHKDLADPTSSDPVARESTRPTCVCVGVPQTTLDPQQMKEWIPNATYGGHAFGFKEDKTQNLTVFDVFLANRDKILPWIAEYSPYSLVTSDAPPIWMGYGEPPAIGQVQKEPAHSANFGAKLQEKCKSAGVPCELVYPGAPDVKHKTAQEFLIEQLKAPAERGEQ